MKKRLVLPFFLLISFLLLNSCGPELKIEGDETASKIILDDSRKQLTIYTRIENTSNLPSDKLFATFFIEDPNLREALGFKEVQFTDYHGNPESFEVSPNSGFFIAETYSYDPALMPEQFTNAVRVVVKSEDGQTVTEFIIHNVEQETV